MPEFSFEMFIINLVSKYCISQTTILYSKCFGFFLLRKKKKRFFLLELKYLYQYQVYIGILTWF